MTEYPTTEAIAIGLGVLTSLHPCLLALNAAAVTILCSPTRSLGATLGGGAAYALGRTTSYVLIGILIILSALAIPSLADFLQTSVQHFLGPLLILVGMVISGLFPFLSSNAGSVKPHRAKRRLLGAFFLGMVHALSFCPASAGLFFGALMPMATDRSSAILLPAIYGVGTALPLLLAIALTRGSIGLFTLSTKRQQVLAFWFPKITGAALILMGVYFTLSRVFGVL